MRTGIRTPSTACRSTGGGARSGESSRRGWSTTSCTRRTTDGTSRSRGSTASTTPTGRFAPSATSSTTSSRRCSRCPSTRRPTRSCTCCCSRRSDSTASTTSRSRRASSQRPTRPRRRPTRGLQVRPEIGPRSARRIGPRRCAPVAARRRQSTLRVLRILPPREYLRPQPAARLAGDAPSRAPAAPLPRSPRGARRRASRRSAFVRTLARPAS